MTKLNKQMECEMIEYIDHLLKTGIYCYGNNTKFIASHLVSNGCRVYIGSRRKKIINKINKKE